MNNLFRAGLRNIKRNPVHASTNLVGLSIGLACCLLAIIFIRDELSYDRFHDQSDRIFRLTMDIEGFGKSAHLPMSFLWRLREEYPEVESATHFYRQNVVRLQNGDPIEEDAFFYTDDSFFDVFSFPFELGDSETALSEPNTIVLTRSAADRIFYGKNPLGATIELNSGESLTITGIMVDPPRQSILSFDALISISTLVGRELPKSGSAHQGWEFLRLTSEASATAVVDRFDSHLPTGEDYEESYAYFGWWFNGMSLDLQPLTFIHLDSSVFGEVKPYTDVRYLYFFGLISAFILLLAAANYVNHVTARGTQRNKEIGVRKSLGAKRSQLVTQFLSESLFFSLVALVLSVGLIFVFIPVFNGFTGKELTADFSVITVAILVAITLATGLLAGAYPALHLAAVGPISALGGTAKAGGAVLRRVLVTGQFAITMTLVLATLVVLRQLDFLETKDLGFESENVVSIDLPKSVRDNAQTFKEATLQLAGIEHASVSGGPPGFGGLRTTKEDDEGNAVFVSVIGADADYLNTMGMRIIAGRDFDKNRSGDSLAVVVNETAARLFGIEDKLEMPEALEFLGAQTPIGIVSDFHTSSLREPIAATLIVPSTQFQNQLVLRLQTASAESVLGQLETLWKEFGPNEPFVYRFLDDRLADQYESEQNLSQLLSFFAILAIGIACLGIVGIAAYTVELRTKEIGIRKVLGASDRQIMLLITRDYGLIFLIAAMISIPIGSIAMNKWLDDFAYHTTISVGLFLIAIFVTIVVAALSVSFQSLRAARANPTDSIRYE